MKWLYGGESSAADVTLVLPTDNRLGALAHVGHVPDSCAIRVEWPLRLFGLLGLLEESETRLGGPAVNGFPQAESLASRLSVQSESVMLKADDFTAYIVPADGCIYSNVPVIEKLVSGLSLIPQSAEFHPVTGENMPAYQYGLKAVLWALALREPAERESFKAGMAYRISAWPVFGEWQSSPVLMRLAALYAREFATLEQGAAFAAVKVSDVAVFLRACSFCSLGLEARLASTSKAIAYPTEQSPGLLQRLRNRLGIGFKRA